MIDLLNKLKALRTLGLNYIGYDSQTEKFKAYEKMCIEEEIWSIELQGFGLLKELIPTMNEAYAIKDIEKYLTTKSGILGADKGGGSNNADNIDNNRSNIIWNNDVVRN